MRSGRLLFFFLLYLYYIYLYILSTIIMQVSQVSTRGVPSGAPDLRGHSGHLGHLKENQGLGWPFRVDTCWTLVDTCSTPETRNPTGWRWGSHLHSVYRSPVPASTCAHLVPPRGDRDALVAARLLFVGRAGVAPHPQVLAHASVQVLGQRL